MSVSDLRKQILKVLSETETSIAFFLNYKIHTLLLQIH